MKVVILAGGFGTRLREIVKDVPKPMAMIAGKPFLEHQIRALKNQGLEDIVLCVHYMANTIKSYFGDGRKFGVEITYSQEETPLGTAGAIKKAEKYIGNTFYVFNGDTFSKIDLNTFLEFHKSERCISSMGLINSNEPKHYGQIIIDKNKIISFSEKNEIATGNALVNSGIYLFEKRIFDYIESEKNVSLEKEIFPRLAKEGELCGFKYEGYFVDIGRPETYLKFRRDALDNLTGTIDITVREAMQEMTKRGTEVLLITDSEKKLLGVINDKIISRYLIGGGNIDLPVSKAMISNPNAIGRVGDSEDKIREQMIISGTRHLPILDELGKIEDIRFRIEEIENRVFPVVRGKSPLRISFAGGGTDLPQFFEKYGGVVINAAINKYCHATAVKRADSKITINTDISPAEIVIDPKEIVYDGNFDLVKAVTKLINPDFGFDLYLHNDVPPGRGLGSSASLAVLITKLIGQLQGIDYNDDKVADIAYRAEREQLGIRGGYQDQLAASMGGFNFMEFSKEKTIIYPLKLKESIINEFAAHLSLCYVGNTHFSGKHQEALERAISEEETVTRLQRMKKIAIDIKDALLTGYLENIGGLLHESWMNKRELDRGLSNPRVDELYETGIKNGAYGGKLLGAGGGGYLLFYHPPEKRNKLVRALKNAGGEPMNFSFDFKGAEVWITKT